MQGYVNMKKYMDFLTGKEKGQSNELLRMQLAEYRSFMEQLSVVSNVMEKKFYIIVPFSPIENENKGFFSNLTSLMNPQKNILEKRENFETFRRFIHWSNQN